MPAQRGCALLVCALVLVVHGVPEEGLGDSSVRMLDDAQELIQQPDLVTAAQTAHVGKLMAQQKAEEARGKMQLANSAAQKATAAALSTQSPDDAAKAVEAKQQAQIATGNHAQAQDMATEAQQRANAAIKAARDAGINVPDMPNVIPVGATTAHIEPPAAPPMPGVKPLAVEYASPPPQISPAPQPSQLEVLLNQRRKERLTRESVKLNRRYDEAKVEHQQAAFALTKAMAKLAKIKRGIAESDSAMSAAKKEADDLEGKIGTGHLAEHAAAHEFEEVKHDEKLAEAFVNEAQVEEQVASSMAYSGGGDDDLEESQERRDDANERLKTAKAEVVARKLGVEKAKAAVLAAKEGFEDKKKKLKELHALLRKADMRYADAKYEKHNNANQEFEAVEDRDQMKSEEENARNAVKIAHGLATAAVMKASGQAKADEMHYKALIEDPEEYAKEIKARVQDQDGISESGQPLISPDGAIAQAYMAHFEAMPLPDSGRNPILEAEAEAQLKDNSGEEAANALPPAQ